MIQPQDVLTFWLEECGPADWYAGGDALDAKITEQFSDTWHAAMTGAYDCWTTTAKGALAYLILMDQFPRNMFRGTAKAFASDAKARAVAKKSVDRGLDKKIDVPARQFFYMPLEHSECLMDQDRAVRLIVINMNEPEMLLHARAHREIIRRFGRFPFRNKALGRTDRAPEQEFMAKGGYGATVEALKAAA